MTVRVEHADMLQAIPALVAEGLLVDAIITDPPYGLEFMGKTWDASMKLWETGAGFAKPGIGDRETPWPAFGAFGAANPTCATCGGRARGAKKCSCVEPAWKPIGTRRGGQPLATGDVTSPMQAYQSWCETWAREALMILRPGGFLLAFGGTRTYHRFACAIEDAGFVIQDTIAWLYGSGFPKHRSHMKPAHEPIVLAYKPGGKRTMQVDECRIGTGEDKGEWPITNRHHDDKTYTLPPTLTDKTLGRWPANVCHDGSKEVVACFPESANDSAPGWNGNARRKPMEGDERQGAALGMFAPSNGRAGEATAEKRYPDDGASDFAMLPGARRSDGGSAARFFFSAKAGAEDRWGSRHPTVKPVDLIAWLVSLVTPPGGTFLDPFAGSGTAAVAAIKTGRNAILIEREASYIADIRERIAFYEGGGGHSVQVKNRNRKIDHGPLFGGDTA